MAGEIKIKELEAKVSVVPGGARGIGKAICQTLAKEGANIILCDVDYKTDQSTANDIQNRGFVASAVKMDVSCGE